MVRRSRDGGGKRAPHGVAEHADELFRQARSILGDRLAECRFDPDRALRVTTIDLRDDDIAAIADVAQKLGIAEWVRTEPADPADLEAWERLRHDVIRLRDSRPSVLQGFPAPEPGYRRPPVEIDMTAIPEAEEAAAELHAAYGTFVSLRVGALPFPPESNTERQATQREPSVLATADGAEMRIQLDGPLVMRRGETATHALLLENRSEHDISVHTNGKLTASIIDPDTGATIGGFSGLQTMPRVVFRAVPFQTVRIPLLVGTASYRPELGYSVPVGHWQLTAVIRLGDGRHLVTPALELTITA